MLIEQLIFTIISFSIFVYIFFKMITKNDTSYVYILTCEAIGITLNFIEVLFGVNLNKILLVIKYLLSVIIPILVIILERRNIFLYEIINLSKAHIYLAFSNNKKAKSALMDLLKKDPENYKAHKLLAEIYEKEGGMRKAIDEYVKAIDIDKKDYESYYKVAKLLDGLDKKDEAAEMLYNLLNNKPDNYEASMLLGDILFENQQYKEAVNVYQNALKYNQYSYDLNYNLGMAYTMLNDFQSAKTCYEKAAEINTISYCTKYDLAEIALIYKDIDEAEKKFLESANNDDLSADSYYELSKIALLKNDKDTAVKYINTAIDINSGKIVAKVKKDSIFIPIMAKISIPFNLENTDEKETKLSKKDIIVKNHLEEMSEITRHLGYDDINLLKRNIDKEKNKNIEKQTNFKNKKQMNNEQYKNYQREDD